MDRRAANMMLQAVPDEVRKELISARSQTSLEILCRLMILYRPGSAVEKSQLLRRVESPEPITTPAEAVNSLRQWWPYFQRAKDLGLVIPDPSLLLRGIDHMVSKPLADNKEIQFRMSLLRYQLKVDFQPTEVNVTAVYKGLLAEFEQCATRKPKNTSTAIYYRYA